MAERLVIIGAGQAGFALAAKLRALKDERPITLIGNEPVLVRISAAKRLREAAEREARRAEDHEVTRDHVETAARLEGAYA